MSGPHRGHVTTRQLLNRWRSVPAALSNALAACDQPERFQAICVTFGPEHVQGSAIGGCRRSRSRRPTLTTLATGLELIDVPGGDLAHTRGRRPAPRPPVLRSARGRQHRDRPPEAISLATSSGRSRRHSRRGGLAPRRTAAPHATCSPTPSCRGCATPRRSVTGSRGSGATHAYGCTNSQRPIELPDIPKGGRTQERPQR